MTGSLCDCCWRRRGNAYCCVEHVREEVQKLIKWISFNQRLKPSLPFYLRRSKSPVPSMPARGQHYSFITRASWGARGAVSGALGAVMTSHCMSFTWPWAALHRAASRRSSRTTRAHEVLLMSCSSTRTRRRPTTCEIHEIYIIYTYLYI